MTVKDLKEFISGLPDDTPVINHNELQEEDMYYALPDLRWVIALTKDPEDGYVFDRSVDPAETGAITAVVF